MSAAVEKWTRLFGTPGITTYQSVHPGGVVPSLPRTAAGIVLEFALRI
jgi:hypothetical protein